jgi:hypothetical protein
MKARWIVVLIAVAVLSGSMGCALLKLTTGQTATKARVTRPASGPVAQATFFGTATPTKTRTPVPTAPTTKTPTTTATPTPAPTKAPAPTSTPEQQRVPADAPAQDEPPAAAPAKAEPTDTPVPPTAEPKPMVGQHGTSTLFTLRDAKSEYKNGGEVKLHIQVKNTTPATMLFGILGINMPTEDSQQGFVAVRSSKYEEIPVNGEIVTDVKVRPVRIGQVRGTVNMTLSMCFSKLDDCQQAGADWEVIAPAITVNIVP